MTALSDRLFALHYRTDGFPVRAFITASPISSNKGRVVRVLVAKNPCTVVSGDVLRTPAGEFILLMDQPNDHSWATNFKVEAVTPGHVWKRPIKAVDAVSKVLKDTGTFTALGEVYCTFDIPEEYGVAGLKDTKYQFLTGQDVHVDDVVGGKIVKYIVQYQGIKKCECA